MSVGPIHSPDTDWASFSKLTRMSNHWNRPGWRPGRSAYYWYLDFRSDVHVRELASRCELAVAGPEFDSVDPHDLHMTVERIGFADEVAQAKLSEAAQIALHKLSGFGPVDIQVGPLAGSSGALSFSVSPARTLCDLRARLVNATHAAGLAADVAADASFRPHIGIGYCNRDTDARPIIERVRKLRSVSPAVVRVREVVLVELVRHERAYSWEVLHRLPLAETG